MTAGPYVMTAPTPETLQAGRGDVVNPCHCQACGHDFYDSDIPVDQLGYYGGTDGEPMDCRHGCGRPAHGSTRIAVYDRRRGRALGWRCPNCGDEVPR